jgi:hypothetical protein
MRTYSFILVVAAAIPLFLACGSGSTSTPLKGAGTGGSATTSSTATGTLATTPASGTGGTAPLSCTDVIDPSVCATCLEGHCCDALATCGATEGCVDCMGGDMASCVADNKAAVDAITACATASCNIECTKTPPDATCTVPAVAPSNGSCITLSADITCNPVTNAPCAAGEACDFNTANGFLCYPPPPANSEPVCAACSLADGLSCKGGESCVNGTCVRFCCADIDCGAGTCDKSTSPGQIIGFCVGGNPP